MKNTKHFLALLFATLVFISCDKDFNTIGEGLVDEDHYSTDVYDQATVKTTNVRFGNAVPSAIGPVQTNNLSYKLLGYYNDPVYGSTTANILTQVGLSEYGKDFGENAVVTKVVLSVPYFSTKISIDEDGVSEYELDSVYGNPDVGNKEIQLKMYRSDYFLNDFDPSTGFEESQKYYSNESSLFEPFSSDIGANLLYENLLFLPVNDEVSFDELDDDGEPVTTRLSPRLRDDSSTAGTNLDITDFNWLVNPANELAMSSAGNFKDFYRGIYFKVENITLDGVLLGLDLSQANIEVTYEYDDPDGGTAPLEDSIQILFTGNSVNTFDNTFGYDDTPVDNIFLKGGEGAMATIELFDPTVDVDANDIADELDALRANNWLINEANLIFYVDQSIPMGGEYEPERIFLYDIDNNKVLLDYLYDTTADADVNSTKVNHLGRLERDDSGNGVRYKIGVTEHITDLVRKDSTNVRLGLVVSNNVTLLGSSEVKDAVGSEPESILSTSIMSHRGTVLFNENAADDDKKLKLKIFYTELED